MGMKRLFYLCPLIPVAVFFLFITLASSAYAERKAGGDAPSTYKRLNATYTLDVNHVYYRDSLMSGVDVASLICGYDFVAGQSFAFDKNRYYQGTPNPRIEKLRQGKCQVGQ